MRAPGSIEIGILGRVALTVSLTLAGLVAALAEQLPIKTYTTADGLARNRINRIVQDSHGFLWFCTAEGLSRFDGYKFTNYTTDQGLPSLSINDLLETRGGQYWIASDDGVCRFNPILSAQAKSNFKDGKPSLRKNAAPETEAMFATYRPSDLQKQRVVSVLIEDRAGAIWCGTYGGLCRLEEANSGVRFHFIDLGMPTEIYDDTVVTAIVEDREGILWVGAGSGLYRLRPDGRVSHYTTRNGLPINSVSALLEDRKGRLWVGTKDGLCQIITESDGEPIITRVYTTKDGLPLSNRIESLFQSSDGKLWVGVFGGLSMFTGNANQDSQILRSYTSEQGLSDYGILALAEDRDGNLWIGTESGGAIKLARSGFTSYNEADGLSNTRIASIIEDQAGELCVMSTTKTNKFIHRFDGTRFNTVRPNVPKAITDFGWGWNQITFQDHTGEWWVVTGKGLYRFPKVTSVEQLGNAHPKAVYTGRNGLVGDEIFRLYEDSRGDIWIVNASATEHGLTRWERATETFHNYSEEDGLPPLISSLITAFCEDASGTLWIATNGSGVARYSEGRFTSFTRSDGVPAGWIRALYLDHAGRLWIAASQGGLSRIDDTKADHPHFVTYTTADGLSSNDLWGVTEDQWGRIYIGTGRGVDRLDTTTGYIKQYTTADGLAKGDIQVVFRDRTGALWFGTSLGLSRLLPEPDPPPSPPAILVSGLRIAGITQRISELGETNVPKLELAPNQNQVEIDFVGLGFGTGEALKYQYMLEGADRDWNVPADQRSINYANLSPGTYRFMVRAVSADGIVSKSPATVSFRIIPPVWQRWWFVTLAGMLVGLTIYATYRYRVARLLELERVRTRIATDLHDDIGSGLSRVAILSEVIKQQMGAGAEQFVPALSEIAESARSLVGSMRDIVWAIDPRRDDLSNVIIRIQQFASDVLESRNIEWDFQAPPELEKIKLDSEQRRHLFLIFKEAINNIARHADCKCVSLNISVAHNLIVAEIRDDGRGFAAPQNAHASTNGRGGHGLENMRSRVVELGGHLSIDSTPGQGTVLKVTIPLKKL